MAQYTDEEISHVAVELCQLDMSAPSFMQLQAWAWLKADNGNKEMMRPLMIEWINKYDLTKYFNYAMGVNEGRRMVEECNKI